MDIVMNLMFIETNYVYGTDVFDLCRIMLKYIMGK